jgi:hypothetical protein
MLLGQGGAVLAATPSADDIQALRAAIQKQQKQLKQQQQELRAQAQRLNQQLRLLDDQQRQIQALRTTAPIPEPPPPPPPPPAPSAPSPPPTEASESSAPVEGPSAAEVEQARNRTVLQTATSLANTGGVLTPRGTLVLEPTFEYDYTAQNQAVVNGFTIVPGITFGNVNVNKITLNQYTPGLRVRLGVTNRLELNAYVPYLIEDGTTTTSPEGPGAVPFNVAQTGRGVGDIQFGGSYQINSGTNGWPVFVSNLQFKTITGTSPFDVPIFTTNDPNNQLGFLTGVQKQLPTGTGFYQLTPSVTALYPTDPGILFANVKYIWNIPRTVDVQSPTGGASVSERLAPGSGLGFTVGLGFSLNEKTSFSLAYEQDFYMSARQNGAVLPGSAYNQGVFDFGIGYQISDSQSVNLGVGTGVGPNVPNATIILRWSKAIKVF